MKKSEVLLLIGVWLVSNWFKVMVIILMVMIYVRLVSIDTDLYGGSGKTGIGNLIIDNGTDLSNMKKSLETIKQNTCNNYWSC